MSTEKVRRRSYTLEYHDLATIVNSNTQHIAQIFRQSGSAYTQKSTATAKQRPGPGGNDGIEGVKNKSVITATTTKVTIFLSQKPTGKSQDIRWA